MFKLSKKADYGLIAVKHLAMHREQHACSANEIADEYGISSTLMAKVLQKLARQNLVAAKHGSSGGYQLAKAPDQISALEVITAIDGPVLITSCVTSHGNCDATSKGSVREPLRRATESDNLMIKGVAEMYREKGNHIITQAIEHKAVLDTCKRLEKYGYEVSYLPVQKDGRVNPEDVRKAIKPTTILITVMYANNEIGVINPIQEIGKIAKERGIIFAVDGVQAVGKIPVDVQKDNIDLLAISAHKIYGPKGVGALYVRRRNPRVQLSAVIDGGGHERGMRSGTLNVPGIVGLGKACEVAQQEMAQESARLLALRERLRKGLEAKLDEVFINGSMEHRPPNRSEERRVGEECRS